jgi:hypothetical protein
MSSGLIDIMKRASMDAVDNAKMCDLRYGTVVSVNPLKVQVTNVFTIPSALLVVPEHLTNHKVSVTLNLNTSTTSEHSHKVSGTHTITIHNALKVGDKVALLRKQGGQSYFILDRI